MRTVLMLAAALWAAAQDQPRPIFRSGIDLVTVDVVVLDKQGRPVTDLQAQDFTVTTGRQQRKVVSAQFVAIPGGSTTAPAPEAEPVAAPSSNTGLPEARSFLFVVDVDGIRAGEGRVAMASLADFLSTLNPNDRAGVVALPTGKPSADLSLDRTRLKATLATIVGGSQDRNPMGPGNADDMSVGEAEFIDLGDFSAVDSWRKRHGLEPCPPGSGDCLHAAQFVARPVIAAERQRARNLFDSLRALAAAMRPLPGLKTIVLVSEGMVSGRAMEDDVRRFAEAAAAARVTLYALELDTPVTEASDRGNRRPTGAATTGGQVDRSLDVQARRAGLADAALAAGGEIFMISGTPNRALQRIDAALTGYYLLSFESDRDDAGSKRRGVSVKVKREDVSVRARTDFAIPGATPAVSKAPGLTGDPRIRVGELLHWPVPVDEIPLDLATFVSAAAPGTPERRVVIAAEVPRGTHATGIGFEVTDAAGKIVSDSFENAPALTLTEHAQTYLAALTMPAGRYHVKLGVLGADGKRGSIEHALWIRASGAGPVRLGEIVVGTEGTGGFTPLARIPDALAQMTLRVELQGTAADALAATAVAFDVIRKGETAPLATAQMQIATTTDPLKRIGTAKLAVGRLPAGEYVLRCTLQTNGTSSERVARAFQKR